MFRLTVLPVLLAVVGLAGCGDDSGPDAPPPEEYEVTGLVNLDGKPLPKGRITFEGTDDATLGLAPASGEIVNGKYAVNARAGKKIVRISAVEEVGEPDVTGLKETRETIAAKFNSESTLEREVVADKPNKFDFEVSSK
jgi:hypothetical protein